MAPSGYSKAADQNITVYSYARDSKIKIPYIKYALKSLFGYYGATNAQIIDALGASGKGITLHSTTIEGKINELQLRGYWGYSTYEGNVYNNDSRVVLQEYLYKIANKLNSKVEYNNTYVQALSHKVAGQQAVISKEPEYGDLRIIKCEEGNTASNSNLLNGAKFVIIEESSNKYVTFTGSAGSYTAARDTNGNMKTETIYYNATKLTTGQVGSYNGFIDALNLDTGKYKIVEVEAPDGHTLSNTDYSLPGSNSKGYLVSTTTVYSTHRNSDIEYSKSILTSILNGKDLNDIYKCLTGKETTNNKKDVNAIIDAFENSNTSCKFNNGNTTYANIYKWLSDPLGNRANVLEYLCEVYARRNGKTVDFYKKDKNGNMPKATIVTNNATILKNYSKMRGITAIVVTNPGNEKSLKIRKVNKDNTNEPLENVGIVIIRLLDGTESSSNYATGFVNLNSNEEISYTNTQQVFKTDENGEILLSGIDPGVYSIYETENPNKNYGQETFWVDSVNNESYSISGSEDGAYKICSDSSDWKYEDFIGYSNKPCILTIKSGDNTTGNINVMMKNEYRYIDISGYVWEEQIEPYSKDETYDGKESEEHKLNNKYDSYEPKINNIPVQLRKQNCEIVAMTSTDGDGSYKFEHIDIDELQNYFITFEYNGMTYQVVNKIDTKEKDTNKCNENIIEFSPSEEMNNSIGTRTKFNNRFATIAGPNDKTNGTAMSTNDVSTGLVYSEGTYETSENGIAKSSTIDYSNGENITLYKGDIKNTNSTEYINGASQYMIMANTYQRLNVSGKVIGNGLIENSEGELEEYSDGNTGELDIDTIKKKGIKEIANINLGLYVRNQPDISLSNRLNNVKVSVGGYGHIYDINAKTENNDEFNMDTIYDNEKLTYERRIFESDVIDSTFGVKVTYSIGLNQANTVETQINSVLDYFDNNYTISSVGPDISADGEASGNGIPYETTDKLGEYNCIKIDTSGLEHINGNFTHFYITFNVNPKSVVDLKDKKANSIKLTNFAELNSYSLFEKDGNNEIRAYAGIDLDSRPQSITEKDLKTHETASENSWPIHEDDEVFASGLTIFVEGKRSISGIVFEDNPIANENNECIGNGYYDEKDEMGIKGVKVSLYAVDDDNNIAENPVENTIVTTGDDGTFTISGFAAGKYKIVYTWGADDGEHSGNDYKGTIFVKNVDGHKEFDTTWYQKSANTTDGELIRYSDAMDFNADAQKTKNSLTPTMAFAIEDEDDPTSIISKSKYYDDEGNPKVYSEFKVDNIDFGIIRRPNSKLEISKDVSNVKIVDDAEAVLVDAKIKKENNLYTLEGQTQNVTYIPSSEAHPNGMLKTEISSEYLNGAKIYITYKITMTNNSETDYATDKYYYFGIHNPNDKPITLQPSGVYDYLDKKMSVDDSNTANGTWEIVNVTSDEYKTITDTKRTGNSLSEAKTDEDGNSYYIQTNSWNSMYSTYSCETDTEKEECKTKIYADRTILTSEELTKKIEPGTSYEIPLTVTGNLSDSDEIELDNDVEIVEMKTNINRIINSEHFFDSGETVIVTPPTGENHNYIIIIASSVTALVILGGGIFLIKKKVLK